MRNKETIFGILFISIFLGCNQILDKAPYYLSQLKKYSGYNYADTVNVPSFVYNNSNDANLKKLKEKFKLEEIAGSGSEMDKIVNLLSWSYSITKFDGSLPYKGEYNALKIIENCNIEDRGIHCGGKAIILLEALLSLDFIARRIVCYSSELIDYDVHSVVITYSQQYNKWIFLDPSSGIYLEDSNGVPLSMQEIRNAFISNKKVHFNSSARKEFDNHLWLSAYYKKNFIRFQSWIYNGFHYASKRNVEDVELRPVNFVEFATNDKWQSATYYTSNPTLFWAKPKNNEAKMGKN